MNIPVAPWVLAVVMVIPLTPAVAPAQPPKFEEPGTVEPPAEFLAEIKDQTEQLGKLLDGLRANLPKGVGQPDDALADVAIFHKAAVWIVRHGEFYTDRHARWTLDALRLGRDRAEQLKAGEKPWATANGGTVRGFVSKVDGSIQPYAVVVPDKEPEGGRYRLDVVLHGRQATLNEVGFIHHHQDEPAKADAPGLVLHVFGRTNNAYRWAGETDVFEAIDAARRNYPVDRNRIVLRGFSMGGAGAWHLGLHHPSSWCAVEAGAGFVDTREYLGLTDLPDVQTRALHIYDAVDYALNAFDVPIAGYGGERDRQLRASERIKDVLAALGVAMTTEGLVTRAPSIDFLQVVGAGVGHEIDPVSATILRAFRDEHAAEGRRSTEPEPIRFITHTLKYNKAPWVSIERLTEHYRPATVRATIEGTTAKVQAENAVVLGVDRHVAERIELEGREFSLRLAVGGLLPKVYFHRVEGGWIVLDYDQSRDLQQNARREKAPGVQGPIDDAFAGPFLCVRGTNRPWNPRVQRWADDRLARFAAAWDRFMRGEVRIKDDVDITPEDIERSHLILFGDPGSNLLIERLLPDLPLGWTKREVALAGSYPSSDHAPALIAPNPLSPLRYVVLNSGHTFGPEAFRGSNALLYPRLGDFGVFRLGDEGGQLRTSGFFNESWRPN